MLLVQIPSNQALTQNNVIPVSSTPILMTNNNASINADSNGIVINSEGIYKVRLQLNCTSGADDIGAVMYADGVAVPLTKVEETWATGDSGEIVIEYPVIVKSAPSPSQALVQFYSTQNATVLTGYITVERVS